jgi:nucleotide-binding universal stress UspA family protein
MNPILVAKTPAGEPYRRVLIGSDLSAADADALALVRGRFPEAQLHVVHVFQWHEIRPLRLAFVAPEVMERYRRRAQAEAQGLLRQFAAEHGLGSNVALHVALGDVARALRLHAGILGADLLVLSPERSWLKAALGASVTRRLLADPPCDLLLAPRAGDRAAETVESAPFAWRSLFCLCVSNSPKIRRHVGRLRGADPQRRAPGSEVEGAGA